MQPDQSLRQLFLDLIDSQVAGFYKPDDKALYVVSRTGSDHRRRQDHVRPRIRPCAAGRELHGVRGPEGPARRDRPSPRPRRRLRGRCDAAHGPVGRRQPDPRGVRRGPGGRGRSRVDGGPRPDAARSSSKACSSRTPPARPSSCRSRRLAAGTRSMPSTTTCLARPSRSSIPTSTGRARSPSRSSCPPRSRPRWATAGPRRSRTRSANSRSACGCANRGSPPAMRPPRPPAGVAIAWPCSMARARTGPW